MFAHIRGRIDAGERAYVVCPRIDADDESDGDDDTSGASQIGVYDDSDTYRARIRQHNHQRAIAGGW